MKNQLTILIPTSPIPSHPSTWILDETITNLRKYTDAKIMIMFDGLHKSMGHRESDYYLYKEKVEDNISRGVYGDCASLNFNKHTHQAGMTKAALKLISTPLIMFCEHDTSPVGEIQFNEICELVGHSTEINYVRFNIFDRILDEHKYLMLGEPIYYAYGVRLVRTIQWSQRPHVAKTQWYRQILNSYFRADDNTMIEDVMHGVVIEKHKELGRDMFGLSVYTPEGNQLRSYHSDGRGDDEKITVG